MKGHQFGMVSVELAESTVVFYCPNSVKNEIESSECEMLTD